MFKKWVIFIKAIYMYNNKKHFLYFPYFLIRVIIIYSSKQTIFLFIVSRLRDQDQEPDQVRDFLHRPGHRRSPPVRVPQGQVRGQRTNARGPRLPAVQGL